MNQFIKRSASVSASDRFFFPPSITSILVEGRIVYLSPTTGNWLVVEPEDQPLLDRLVAGEKIGTLAASLKAPNDLTRLKRLLAQITARQFALTDSVPVPSGGSLLKALISTLPTPVTCGALTATCFQERPKPASSLCTSGSKYLMHS